MVPLRGVFLVGIVAAAVETSAAAGLGLRFNRPAESTWKRTQCGSPSGEHPAVPAGPYTEGVDYPGNDIIKCPAGAAKVDNGCVLAPDATPMDCEAMCNNTKNCVAYIFAPANCSQQSGPLCWAKGSIGQKDPRPCRNSKVMGQPASTGTDIPTQWGKTVQPSSDILPEYPRPQMVRGSVSADHTINFEDGMDRLRDQGDPSKWTNLNGLWEWEPATDDSVVPFGKTLASSILVPFPVESCLSGVAPNSSDNIVMKMWYRITFDAPALETMDGSHLQLNFGAIDWNSTVYLNRKMLGNHVGGYDGFSFTIDPSALNPSGNELIVYVYDPSDTGSQPNGKQRVSAISRPGGDTYTPSSGIWQTVWIESVPDVFIESLTINQASTTAVTVTTQLSDEGTETVSYSVKDATGATVASGSNEGHVPTTITIPSPQLWNCTSPTLYTLVVTVGSDTVTSYFGLRTYELGDGPKGKRPLLNGKFAFAAGFLDQSWWPDGQYTAPTDDALAYDVEVLATFGLNMIRLHQKVNSERWYYHADKNGVLIFQDMVQKYGGASSNTIPFFVSDLQAMIKGRGNHPSIVQIETFNEGDCWSVFKTPPYDVPGIVALARKVDTNARLVDTDSGGGANNLHIGDVNDIHSYPWPGDPQPSETQYAMVGEFGGIGAFQEGHMWTPSGCHTYLHVDTATEEASTYVQMAEKIKANADHISASVYTQTTDLENECDGFLNYDRTNKFSEEDTNAIKAANLALRQAAETANNI